MSLVSKYKFILLGGGAGALGGYAYYYFVGCASNTCPITSHPFNSTAYGAVVGVLLFSLFKKDSTGNEKHEDNK